MCGIAGWIDFARDLTGKQRLMEAMTTPLYSRGPDAAGVWTSRHAALGHRRLIVVDPAWGQQPMVRRYGGHEYVITYNGELYNTAELRQKLISRGHLFYTDNSDTEVLLVAYIEWR